MGGRAHAKSWQVHLNDDALAAQHAPPLGNFTPIYDVPRVENTIDEQALRDFTIWILERMQVYAPITELGNAVAGVIPAIAVHATNGRFDVAFASPAKEQVEIATLRWRQPPWKRGFRLADHLDNAPPCNETISNSFLWDPLGNQWGRNDHWPLIITYGTTRYRCKGMVMRRELAAERRWEQRQAGGEAQTYDGDVALAGEEAPEA